MKKLIERAALLAGQRVDGSRLHAPDMHLEEVVSPDEFVRIWRMLGLSGVPQAGGLHAGSELPAVAWMQDGQALLLLEFRGGNAWVAEQADGSRSTVSLTGNERLLTLPKATQVNNVNYSALHLVKTALLQYRGIFLEGAVATALVNLLALASSLYSMQVYDRVIPNQGFQTLWVLTVGVALALVIELVLKQVRSQSVDRVGMAVDHTLSAWFFERMMRIRMEVRPASVGTLASQVKGFELVRGVLASTSLFVLTDIPFAVFFIAVIGMIGGWLVLVPLVFLPLSLLTGLVFQHAIARHSRANLASSNRKAGLLVEAVDGAESVKAMRAEWWLQARWNALGKESAETDMQLRTKATLSQNLTMVFQQLGYIALVALGAYLVANNQLTMGGLLACTIISNRAMAPIVQLPGVMVQWAHARAALEGLDKIIALKNESDEAKTALAPQTLQPSIRLEGIQYAYPQAHQAAVELARMDIPAGDRVGILGSIGSGKSTLLKLISGLYRPTHGNVYLGGVDQSLLAPHIVRELVGYIPQDARLFSGTLRENLVLGLPDPGDDAILAAANRTGLLQLVAGHPRGLMLDITEGGRGVSGGQKQLILLTRALIAKPRVWILDEPTGAMDSVTEARIVKLLQEVAEEGATVIAATHKTALLPLFNRLVILQSGKLLLDGPRDAVLAKISGGPRP
jgi:ATP-binding cassette subfamily C protein LapB